MIIGDRGLTGWALRLTQVAAALLIILKFVQLLTAGPFMDETYYWMWGQHPALSYYDHPPMVAWTLWLSSKVLGWNIVALRAPVALTFLASIGALALIARRIGGEKWQAYFWPTLILFLTTPMYWALESYALPDHVLLASCLWAVAFFHRFFAARAEGKAGTNGDLLLAAFFLGLAGLSKYNAAFLAGGVALFVLVRDRRLLSDWRLYAAAALTLAMQAPVIIWNLTQHFASWGFILKGRDVGLVISPQGLLPLLAGLLLGISPFLFWPIWTWLTNKKNNIPGDGFARATFVLSSVVIVAVGLTTTTVFHWNLVAYATMLPFLARFMRPRWLLAAQAIFGGIFIVLAYVNYAVVPLTNVEGWRDKATAWSYGWPETAAAVAKAQAESGASLVVGSEYSTASLLGYASGNPDVTTLSPRTDQYDFWFDRAAHAGEDAILVGDTWQPLRAEVEAQFETVTEVARLEVVRFGRHLDTHVIYLGKGFKADG